MNKYLLNASQCHMLKQVTIETNWTLKQTMFSVKGSFAKISHEVNFGFQVHHSVNMPSICSVSIKRMHGQVFGQA